MHINDLFKTKKAHFIVEFIFNSIYWTFKYPLNWKTISRSFALRPNKKVCVFPVTCPKKLG